MYKLKSYVILLLIGFFSFGAMYYVTAKKKIEVPRNITKDKSENFTSLEIERFRQLLSSKKGVLIDVRTSIELESGKINGAKNINFYGSDFDQQINSLNKNQTFFLYGSIGSRSKKVMLLMSELEFTEVYSLKNGIRGWKTDGYRIKK